MKFKKIISVLSTVLAMCLCFSACGAQGPQGVQGPQGPQGPQGAPGKDGTQITIGENGNWFLDGVDTGISASGSCDCNNGGSSGSGDNGGNSGGNDGVVDEDGYTPVIRFAVTSDLHLRDADPDDFGSRKQLKKFIGSAYDYSESQTDYDKLDGMFFAGDYTQNGSQSEQTYFYDYLETFTKAETTTRTVMGNHEFYATYANGSSYSDASMTQAPKNYLKYSGYDSVDEHLEINGYHFIFLSMDEYNSYTGSGEEFFSDAKLNWLDGELKKAANDDATGKKPIFVVQHESPENTMVGSVGTSGDSDLTKVLEKYPQVVDFSGHTHRPLSDPRTIWQGTFTALNTGSLAYLGATLAGHPDYDQSGVAATNKKGSWEVGDIENAERTGGMYYIVEVNEENVVRVLRYNMFTDSLFGDPYVFTVGDTDEFIYTNARKTVSEAPVFAEGAALELKSSNYKQVMIEIPQASCPDLVQNYRCEVYKGSTKVDTVYRLACNYYGDAMPSVIELPITGLSASTQYTVKVYAVNSWGVQSEKPLQISVTTTAANPTTPDILSVRFNDDGTATNVVTGKTLDKDGAPNVASNVATFDGNSAYRYTDMTDWYAVMAKGFTIETYVYLSQKPSEGNYVDIFSNQEAGGFGFEYKADGKVYFFCNAGGGYVKPSVSVSTGTWVHLVGVYDGSSVKLYLNGNLAQSVSGGAFKAPAYYARYLCVGADPGYAGEIDCAFKGKIKVANLYSSALTADQIKAKYNAL